MPVSMEKVQQHAPELVNLVKTASDQLGRSNLTGHVAKVALILDFSGSMKQRYMSGEVQELAERALALGTRFDDDGDIDIFLFDERAEHAGTLSIEDYKGGIDRLTRGRHMGTTDYAAAVHSVLEFYEFAKWQKRMLGGHSLHSIAKLPADQPVYAIFVTDGEPDDRNKAETAIVEAAKYPVFWQFIGLGQSFDFLEELDNMSGRVVDNANFFAATSHRTMSDEQLFSQLLGEYPGWVPQVQRMGMIR